MTSTVRANTWSITLNMKNVKKSTCDDMIQRARSAGWKITGQEEMGGENPHYQLMVQTPQVRFSAVKKMFPTGHIEPARNVRALANYVQKEETRIGALPEHDEKYISGTRLWDMIYQYHSGYNNDCWDYLNEDELTFYKEADQRAIERDPLAFFDKMMGIFIRKGYYVDMLACNPAVRSLWKKFWRDILYRSRETDRQTDRQSEIISETVNIPTIDGEDDEEREDGTTDSGEESAPSDSEGDEDGESSSSPRWNEGIDSQADSHSDRSGYGE